MTKYGEGSPLEALEALGIYDPNKKYKKGYKPNVRILKYLCDRGFDIGRRALNKRKIMYDIQKCRALAELARVKGISLTIKPEKL